MAISKKKRFEVMRRDGFSCRYCGARAPETNLVIDHVIPVALGGSDDPQNLVSACNDCNSGKAATPLDAPVVEEIKETDLRWADAFRRAAELRNGAEAPRRDYVQRFDLKWNSWAAGHQPVHRDEDWRRSLETWHDLGVPIDEIERLVDVALGNSRVSTAGAWRYFCGCVWRYVEEVRELAVALLAKEEADGA